MPISLLSVNTNVYVKHELLKNNDFLALTRPQINWFALKSEELLKHNF